jgi:branched-chain amino acid transport system substrate-binding protein
MRALTALCFLLLPMVLGGSQPYAEPLVVGVAGPMSGQFELFGRQMADGARMAAEDVNRNGGINARQLQISVADTACNLDKSVAVAKQLVSNGAAVVIGQFCSRPSMAAAKIYSQARLVQISPAAPDPKFTSQRPDNSGGTYRVGPAADEHLSTLTNFLLANWREKKISLINDGSDYGKELVQGVLRELRSAQIQPVVNETFRTGQKSFRSLVSKLNAARTDISVIGAYHADIAAIYTELARRKRKIILIAGDAAFVPDLVDLAGGSPERIYVVAKTTPEALIVDQAFSARVTAAGLVPGHYFLSSYAAVRIWAGAMAAAGSKDYDEVVSELNKQVFATPLGDIAFDDNGNWSRPGYSVYQLRDGRFEPAKP